MGKLCRTSIVPPAEVKPVGNGRSITSMSLVLLLTNDEDTLLYAASHRMISNTSYCYDDQKVISQANSNEQHIFIAPGGAMASFAGNVWGRGVACQDYERFVDHGGGCLLQCGGVETPPNLA